MNIRKSAQILTAALALTAVVVMISCDAPPVGAGAEVAVELKTYQVPEGLREDVAGQLRHLFHRGDAPPRGRVTSGPGGRLLVLAPPEIHAGIQKLIREFDGLSDLSATLEPLKLTYWVVAGRTLPADAVAEGPYRIAGSRRVQPIEPVLTTLTEVDGPSEFVLLERLELTSSGKDWVTANGRTTHVRQRATRMPGGAMAEIHLETGPNGLGTELRLEPGKTLVLGQAGYGGRPIDAFGNHDRNEVTLYYVLTSDL